jgi:hypothetical protein
LLRVSVLSVRARQPAESRPFRCIGHQIDAARRCDKRYPCQRLPGTRARVCSTRVVGRREASPRGCTSNPTDLSDVHRAGDTPHGRRARVYRWRNVAARRVRRCARVAQRCCAPCVHVCADGATLLRAVCARVRGWRNVVARRVCTCAPMAQRCCAPCVHVCADGATLLRGVCARARG